VQFAQVAGEMPGDILEDMMAMYLAEGGGVGGGEVLQAQAGQMPGQMPGFEFLGEEVPGEFVRREMEEEMGLELGDGDGDGEEEGEEEEEEEEEDLSVSCLLYACCFYLPLNRASCSPCRVF